MLRYIHHSRTKAKSPQTNGICERFHRTCQEEFYAIAFRKKIYASIEELQVDLDKWMKWYNEERTHSGKHCFGKTPMQTFEDTRHLALEKRLDELPWRAAAASANDKLPLSIKNGELALEDDAVRSEYLTVEIPTDS